MLRVGDVVAGRYRLIAPLAEGGMGAVWRAEHVELRVEVALKVLLDRVANADSERRFRREAQAAAKLISPHVVRVHDLGIFEGQPYLAMELLQGETLEQRIEREGPMPLERCAPILEAIAKAIQLAHEHGIIHRDIKPANVFLTTGVEGEGVKVLDFGIAKVQASESNNTTGQGLLGSPAYMSPEQVWNETLDPSTDVWSLGVIAFEMVAGQNPFEGGPLAKVFQRIVGEPLPRIGTFRKGLPMDLETFFERALARPVQDRFPSALALSAAFRSAIESAPSSAVPREVDGVALPAEPPLVRRVDPHARTLDAPRSSTKRVHGRQTRATIVVGATALLLTGVYFLARRTTISPSVEAVAKAEESSAAVLPSSASPPQLESSVAMLMAPPSSTPVLSSPVVSKPSASASASNTVTVQRTIPRQPLSSKAPIAPPVIVSQPSAGPTTAAPSVDPKFGIPRAR